ncbi:hypothetical protein ACLBX9_03945 [Methylobacterium sp. A49B]
MTLLGSTMLKIFSSRLTRAIASRHIYSRSDRRRSPVKYCRQLDIIFEPDDLDRVGCSGADRATGDKERTEFFAQPSEL